MRFARSLISLLMLSSLLAPAGAAVRHEVSLNGEWQFQKVAELAYPPAGAWQKMAVPGYLTGTNYERAWLRREFAAPPEMRERRVEIAFGGVKWNSVVYLNGRKVGGHFGGHEAFAVDVTNALRFDAPNELLVGVHDWTGAFVDRETDLSPERIRGEVRGVPRDKILAPIGGMVNLYGIWDEVTLRSHPAVYIRDCFVQPSVRRKELVVRVTVANAGAAGAIVQVGGQVREAAAPALLPSVPAPPAGGGPSLRERTATVPPGGEATLLLSAPWADPHLWSHEDPFLYHLRLGLRVAPWTGGGTPPADELEVRFGFREFWTDGPDFYLNGHKVHLLATSWWPPRNWPSRDEIRAQMRAIKASHTFAFRTHTQPWPRVWYEVADEVGLLMIPEGAVWNDDSAYRVDDPRFWENYGAHLRGMVDHLKNHPSVVMWSLENEMYGGRMNDQAPARKDLARMGLLMKEWDPTRPITYESDGDPEGVADVIGIHYPHEYPEFTQWPNEADWMRAPIRMSHAFTGGTGEFFWEREKPVYVGEFLWIPSSDPSWDTVFFGDDAYRDYREYHRLAKAEAWRVQILGYRRHEVSGISPWTMIEGGPLDETNPMYRAHLWAYRPVAAFLREYDRRFFAGERVARTVDLYNDTLRGGTFEFSWRLLEGEKKLAGAAERLDLAPGAHVVRTLTVPAPVVKARESLSLVLEMRREGKVLFQESYPFAVYPAPRLRAPAGASVALYDPAGRTGLALARLGLRCRPIPSLQSIPAGVSLLVVGAGAFRPAADAAPVIGATDPLRERVDRFVAGGGRVLVLEQAAYPPRALPAALTSHRSTMTFPLATGHPALAGLSADDLRFWRGDHRVSAGELARPRTGGGRALVVSGSQEGLAHAPLLEIPRGKGVLLLSQMLLGERLEREPAAVRLLQNCLGYLAAYRPTAGRAAVIASDPAFPRYLKSLGLRFDDLSGKLSSADLSPYRLLIAQGEVDALLPARAGVEALVRRGGAVLLHRPTPEAFASLRPLHGSGLVPRPHGGSVLLADQGILPGVFAREDLYWLGIHTGVSWTATPLATGMADYAFTPELDAAKAVAYDARTMKAEGAYAGTNDAEAYLASSGTLTGEIEVPRAGAYVLGLVARSTPAGGVYAAASVALGGPQRRSLGAISTASREWDTYTLFAELPAGRHPLLITFTNDGQVGGEDRNFYLQKVLLAPAGDGEAARAFATVPPALVSLPGDGGRWYVDAIRWDTEQANAVKAARFACALLSALGGQLEERVGVAVEAEAMDPNPEMPHFRRTTTSAALAAAGYIETEVQIARAGAYQLDVVARGTPAQGTYPIVEVLLDGKSLGSVQLMGDGWRAYPLAARLPAGKHRLRLAFTNDLNAGGEDRNLQLDKVVFYAE